MGSVAAQALTALDQYFELEVFPPGAPTENLEKLYALRFSIFCEECGFMPTDHYPDGLERDNWDPAAAHFAARNADHRIVGTSRLVLVPPGDPFPYEAHCQPFPGFQPPDPAESAEVSRLAVDRSYRRRAGDTVYGINPADLEGPRTPGEQGADKRVNAPLLVLGLYREMYRYSRAHGIRYWYAAMERSLAKVLALYGFVFKPIGPEQDYYGPVTPYLGDLRDLEDLVRSYNPKLLDWFQHG
ncbi:PEP-CTERM/exosortase system-associated acyltransferase [Pseudohaliea sp.]|uniref:PEP-CTERM/exosortase system-associated acyltransferase n=1 Tax=Pseudohaliea sp. TaxID=2740289 RepID=UPI0032EBF07D